LGVSIRTDFISLPINGRKGENPVVELTHQGPLRLQPSSEIDSEVRKFLKAGLDPFYQLSGTLIPVNVLFDVNRFTSSGAGVSF
jgi:hypothetical protein